MVLDTSALAAILFGETKSSDFLEALASPQRLFMSALTKLELSIVVEARKGQAGTQALAELLAEAGVETVAFDSGQAELAFDAWRRYGKGRHPAGLNLGDCAAYALARQLDQKLLYKGNDFSQTDVAR
ncbi:MAG: type II toxin-antitoxin system VapC family toxin [Spirochaetes bacterium]|nr:type II toxin-antitoxin system VapC family toxin [Spirochaetota bacterium]MBU0954263.1 type II toxin-antitoxin system VapC family toxin [Spirochaetota bacterium]